MLRLVFASALLVSLPVAAQSLPSWADPVGPAATTTPPGPGDGGPGGGPGTPGDPGQEVPIDGGLGLLALAGAGYAARRLRSR